MYRSPFRYYKKRQALDEIATPEVYCAESVFQMQSPICVANFSNNFVFVLSRALLEHLNNKILQ